jgi:hypothetical protein
MPQLRDFGLNLQAVHCPACEEKMSFLRVPNSLRQALWGGWNCPTCGCEMNKWGERIPRQPAEAEPTARRGTTSPA